MPGPDAHYSEPRNGHGLPHNPFKSIRPPPDLGLAEGRPMTFLQGAEEHGHAATKSYRHGDRDGHCG